MAVKTQGTQLFVIDPDGSAGCEVLAIQCATSLSGLGAPREQIETTCLEDTARTYVGGLATPGQLTVSVNFDPGNATHLRLYELWKANTSFDFAIGFGPETDVPDVDSACGFDLPTGRSFAVAEGYVVDVPMELALNTVVTATIPIQLSGDYVLHPKVA